MAPARFLPRELTERFEVEGTIGRSGEWETLIGEERETGDTVIIRLSPDSPETPRERRHLEESYLKLRRLRHEGLPRVIHLGIPRSGGYYLVHAFARGANLRNLAPHLDLTAMVDILSKLLPALHLLHLHGIVHQRLSPETIIVEGMTPDRKVRIVGTGVSPHPDGRRTAPETYRAPELGAPGRFDGRADLYSLAVIYYELLTGRHPFPEGRATGLLGAMDYRDVPPIRTEREDCPPTLEEILMRMGSHDPRSRPKNAWVLGKELPRTGLLRGEIPTLDLETIVESFRYKTTERRVQEILNLLPPGPLPTQIECDEGLEDIAEELRARASLRRPKVEIHVKRGPDSLPVRRTSSGAKSGILKLTTMQRGCARGAEKRRNGTDIVVTTTERTADDVSNWMRTFVENPIDNHRVKTISKWSDQLHVESVLRRMSLSDGRPRFRWVSIQAQVAQWAIESRVTYGKIKEEGPSLQMLAKELELGCLHRSSALLLRILAKLARKLGQHWRALRLSVKAAAVLRSGTETERAWRVIESSLRLSPELPSGICDMMYLTEMQVRLTDGRANKPKLSSDCESIMARQEDEVDGCGLVAKLKATLLRAKILQSSGDLVSSGTLLRQFEVLLRVGLEKNNQPLIVAQLKGEVMRAIIGQSLCEYKNEQALEQIGEAGDAGRAEITKRGELRWKCISASVMLRNGEPRRARKHAARAAKEFLALGDLWGARFALENLALSERLLGAAEKSVKWKNAISGFNEFVNSETADLGYGISDLELGDARGAAGHAIRAFRKARLRGNARIEAMAPIAVAEAYLALGDYRKAHEWLFKKNVDGQFENIRRNQSCRSRAEVAAVHLKSVDALREIEVLYESKCIGVGELIYFFLRRGDVRREACELKGGIETIAREVNELLCRFRRSSMSVREVQGVIESVGPVDADIAAGISLQLLTQCVLWAGVEVRGEIVRQIYEHLRTIHDFNRPAEFVRTLTIVQVAALQLGWLDVAKDAGRMRAWEEARLARGRPRRRENGGYNLSGLAVKADAFLTKIEIEALGLVERTVGIQGTGFVLNRVPGAAGSLRSSEPWLLLHGSPLLAAACTGAIGERNAVLRIGRNTISEHSTDGVELTRALAEARGLLGRTVVVESPGERRLIVGASRDAKRFVICELREDLLYSRASILSVQRSSDYVLNSAWESSPGPKSGEVRRGRKAQPQMREVLPVGRNRVLIAKDPRTKDALDVVARLARRRVPILLRGSTGVGKELFARFAHECVGGGRSFVAVDCPSIATELAETELFGHRKGAFTGAIRDRLGLLLEADGGTLFLDEVGDLTPRVQAKVLRVLSGGEVRRLGDNSGKVVDSFVVSATNRDLGKMVSEGAFREDLLFRLGIEVHIPDLKDRRLDIRPLWEHFLLKHGGHGDGVRYEDTVIDLLLNYDWPGNVREMEAVARAVAVAGEPASISCESVMRWLRGVSGVGRGDSANAEGSRLEAAVSLLRKNKRVTRREYSKLYNVSPRTALRDLKLLERRGIVSMKGQGRSTKYVLVE